MKGYCYRGKWHHPEKNKRLWAQGAGGPEPCGTACASPLRGSCWAGQLLGHSSTTYLGLTSKGFVWKAEGKRNIWRDLIVSSLNLLYQMGSKQGRWQSWDHTHFQKGHLSLQSKYKHNEEHLYFPALNPWCINKVFQRKLQLLLCPALGTEGNCVPSRLIKRTCCTQYVAKASRRGASASHQQQVSSQGNREHRWSSSRSCCALQHVPSALLLTAGWHNSTESPDSSHPMELWCPCQLRKVIESNSTKQSLPEEPWLPLLQVKNLSLVKIYDRGGNTAARLI